MAQMNLQEQKTTVQPPPNVLLADILTALRVSAQDRSYSLYDVESMVCTLLDQVRLCIPLFSLTFFRYCERAVIDTELPHRNTSSDTFIIVK
jgi:hypothetical protein